MINHKFSSCCVLSPTVTGVIKGADNITQKRIDSVVLPRQKQVIIRDSEITGFGLRLSPGGASFIAEARVSGKSRRITIGRAELFYVEEARKEAVKLLAQMTSGIDPPAEKAKSVETAWHC